MELCEISFTCGSIQEANTIINELIESRFVSCAQQWPITSTYWWEGAVHQETEIYIQCKTTVALLDTVTNTIKKLHSYELPAISAHTLFHPDKALQEWVIESTI